jgi:DNA-binding NarL/FixJ family response regulator
VTPIRLLVADEHALFRAAIAAAINGNGELTVVDEAADGPSAVERAQAGEADLVALSIGVEGMDGLKACAAIKAPDDCPRVVIMSEAPDQAVLCAAIEAGADGYVTKDMPLDGLVAALKQVGRGEAYVPPGMLGTLLRLLIDGRRETDRAVELFMQLTNRETEVLELLVAGCDHEAVAEALVISPQTARTHIQNVISKLGVHSRLEAVALAVEHNLIDRMPAKRRP